MKLLRVILIIVVVLLIPQVALGQECPGAHCSAKSEQINNICKANGQSGNLVFVELVGWGKARTPTSTKSPIVGFHCIQPNLRVVAIEDDAARRLG